MVAFNFNFASFFFKLITNNLSLNVCVCTAFLFCFKEKCPSDHQQTCAFQLSGMNTWCVLQFSLPSGFGTGHEALSLERRVDPVRGKGWGHRLSSLSLAAKVIFVTRL